VETLVDSTVLLDLFTDDDIAAGHLPGAVPVAFRALLSRAKRDSGSGRSSRSVVVLSASAVRR
jgi:rhodanese-related sulfurtransferase